MHSLLSSLSGERFGYERVSKKFQCSSHGGLEPSSKPLSALHKGSVAAQVVAEKMQEQQLEQGASIQWQVGDMLCLPFCDASLDVVIEKGALDVFLVDRQSPWDPAPVAAARMRTALLEIHRCSSCQTGSAPMHSHPSKVCGCLLCHAGMMALPGILAATTITGY